MEEFIEGVKTLARNPLGIIALFITLIYGLACLVLKEATLDSELQLILIWFLVLFPILVLGVFVYLVVWHYPKLYAPSDYKNENNFFKATLPEKIDEQLDHEIENDEIIEPLGDKKQQYMMMKSLAIKEIERRSNIDIKRHVSILLSDKERLEVDGISEEGHQVSIYEVKYIREGILNNRLIKVIGNTIESINGSIYLKKRSYRIIVVIVCKNERKEMIKQQIETCFSNSMHVKFEVMAADELSLSRE